MLIHKKKIKINEKSFIISMIPAYYALKLIPKFQEIIENPPEDYDQVKDFLFGLLSYCRLVNNSKLIRITHELIEDELSPYDLQQLQEKLILYNQHFLALGRS